MSGQTLTDRIAAAQYQLTGSDMARAVCKATTHEVMAPKKKHLECKCSTSSFLTARAACIKGEVDRPHVAYSTHRCRQKPHAPRSLSYYGQSLGFNGCGAIMN